MPKVSNDVSIEDGSFSKRKRRMIQLVAINRSFIPYNTGINDHWVNFNGSCLDFKIKVKPKGESQQNWLGVGQVKTYPIVGPSRKIKFKIC